MTISEAKHEVTIAERQFDEACTPQQVEVACLRLKWAQAQLSAVIAEMREGAQVC